MMKRNLIYLSQWDDSRTVTVPEEIGPILKNYDIIGIRFMYDAYIKKRKGIILNEEEGMSIFLQITAFLSALFHSKKGENVALVVCTQNNLTKWFYHFSKHGNFKVSLLNGELDISGFPQENSVVLVSVNNINYVKTCQQHKFFSVVIENLESIANKLILKKLSGEFNIGVTCRNFLLERDQKAQFNMLKWVNPEKYGKLSQFTEEDNEHFKNFIEAYSDDWLRLTWSYSETFRKNTSVEDEEFQAKVAEYAKENNLFQFKKATKIEYKRKSDNLSKEASKPKRISSRKASNSSKIPKKHTEIGEHEKQMEIEELDRHMEIEHPNNSYEENLPGTSYSFENSSVKLPCMDESPILTSIIRNLQGSAETDTWKSSITKESILSSLIGSPDTEIHLDSCSTSKISHEYFLNEPTTKLSFLEDNSE